MSSLNKLDIVDVPEAKKQQWTILRSIGLSCIVGVVAFFLYYGFLETRINTPLSYPKVVVTTGLEDPSRYWGTYRPGLIFWYKRSSCTFSSDWTYVVHKRTLPKQHVGF
ncbi:hypothetical protein Anas_08280 [Armadillidium nasatum]|uniref:Uncharacterized protein n=1 Tax=Armadillidium nasatum TaxID=96803 RepID=A0A5N5SLU2_9CRUS|nr:hypothetical protein Anas_08280 [Armadillidium nasatum]